VTFPLSHASRMARDFYFFLVYFFLSCGRAPNLGLSLFVRFTESLSAVCRIADGGSSPFHVFFPSSFVMYSSPLSFSFTSSHHPPEVKFVFRPLLALPLTLS